MEGNVGQQRGDNAPLGSASGRRMPAVGLHVSGVEPAGYPVSPWEVSQGVEQEPVVDVVKTALDIGVEHPRFAAVWTAQMVEFAEGIVSASAGAEAVAGALEPGFPFRFERRFHHGLVSPVSNGRDTQRSYLSVGFWDVYPSGWPMLPQGGELEAVDQLAASFTRFH